MKIVVLAGGYSDERDVSLSSGSLIANALIENGHDVLFLDLYDGLVGIDKIDDLSLLFVSQKNSKKFVYTITELEPRIKDLIDNNSNKQLIGPNVIKICKAADIVFIGLHGSIGENGQIQAIFDMEGIRYTGTGYIGSLLAMDKDISKTLMSFNGVKTAAWQRINSEHKDINLEDIIIPLPFVVKPCSNGSSIGVSIVKTEEEFCNAISKAQKHEKNILIEKYINGREFSVGILNHEALPIVEIITESGLYDYCNKYQPGLAKEICPAQLGEELALQIKNTAMQVHEILRLGFYSRVDFILDENSNLYCLEANTLPGMTPTSLLPQEAESIGIAYNQLCEMICQSTMN